MPTIRLISRVEAQQTRATKPPGVRSQRRSEFATYVQPLLENPAQAVVYQGIEENSNTFVLSLRAAFKRAGVDVVVRKMRDKDEVRAGMAPPKVAPPQR